MKKIKYQKNWSESGSCSWIGSGSGSDSSSGSKCGSRSSWPWRWPWLRRLDWGFKSYSGSGLWSKTRSWPN